MVNFMKIAAVAVSNAAFSFDKVYDYSIPEELVENARPGCRVSVTFGKSSKKRIGIIFDVFDGEKRKGLKAILEVLDESSLLNDEMLRLAQWMKERTFCTLFEAAKAMLPTGINHHVVVSYSAVTDNPDAAKLSGTQREIFDYLASCGGYVKRETLYKNLGLSSTDNAAELLLKKGMLVCNTDVVRNVGDASVRMLMLNESEPEFVRLTAKQKLVVETLRDVGCATVKEICYFTGVTPAVPNALVNNGFARWVEFEVLRTPTGEYEKADDSPIVLTDEQNKAYTNISKRIMSGKAGVTLLYGVTGSGKTSVYLKAIDDTVNAGKSVIVMVPEISLTPQTLSLFRCRYGESIAVFHSALSAGERADEWKRVKNGDAKIVIGTRSAVFAPLENIGLIIIDEEQEHTYKSEQSPRYNAIEVAKFRAVEHNCLLLLSSATPSIESYANAVNSRYSLEKLTHRYGRAVLPDVVTVDMLTEPKADGCESISQYLLDELKENVNNKMQSILLINRRGYNTFVACNSCGHVVSCPNCSISMTYHSANGRLMCHYCGRSVPFTKTCPECGQDSVRYSGFGTQKIEDELARLIPEARILRMDTDTTSAKNSHERFLGEFSQGKYDIMIGTQMVAKGLDFENVTLVGVVSVDQQLYNDDFRSLEKTFSLLTQVVGRSGRGEHKGRAVIQTMTPENEIIRLAAKQDYEAFFKTEISIRKSLVYPPYCDICVLAFICENEIRCRAAANFALERIMDLTNGEYSKEKIIVLGPRQAKVYKVNNKYRYRLIVKCKNSKGFREMISKILIELGERKEFSIVTSHADINPDSIM